MKHGIVVDNAKTIFVCLLMTLTSCASSLSSSVGITSESTSATSTSSIAGSTSSEDASSSDTSSGSSVEIPPDGETIAGTSTVWPTPIIETIFTSAARFDIPVFASESPYMYQYTVTPSPWLAIMTGGAEPNSVAVYEAQLEAEGWIIHPEFQLMEMFIVAVDSNSEMMIMFLLNEDEFVIEIGNYDPSMFEDFDIDTSATWPAEAIDGYFGFEASAIIPPFSSANPYYFVIPAEEGGSILIFTEALEDAMSQQKP